jgi:DNA polymerase-3 subunit epsilon
VFTGSLSISRPEAADAAAAAGCSVDSGVTRHTTMLVVGGQNLQRRTGHKKSSKHLIAEQFIARGQAIRILGEIDFLRLVARAETQQVSE